MKLNITLHKAVRAISWLLIALFALFVITDALCAIGLNRAWQYLYNAAFFVIILPGLLYVALIRDFVSE